MYYYALKLHALEFRLEKQLPFPEQMLNTPASENDLNVFRNAWSNIENRPFFGDKFYHDHDFFERLLVTQNAVMLTSVKGINGQSEWEKQNDRVANSLLSTDVSKVRQPI